MIEIKNLTKIYCGGKEKVRALNDVSFVLPNSGLVFILGKSGSGKSTLLNMLGGLDSVTKGDIVVDGTSLVSLKEYELDMYRNEYIGIIYQNFNLFPSSTVRQNILEASKIAGKEVNKEDVNELCKGLDLLGKEDELVKNLSGGQKQRVAIARALIKNPKIILADEPTGNLDSKTTKVIFDTLKNISKDKLVIVISHDSVSADTYADRIISLSDGEIVSDVVRNEDYLENTVDEIILPINKKFSEEEITNINKSLKKHNLKANTKKEKFIEKTQENIERKDTLELKEKRQSLNLSLGVSWKFLKSTMISFITTLIMLTFIIGVLSIAQTFAKFDSGSAILDVANTYKNKSFIMNKSYSYYDDPERTNKKYQIEVTEEDIELFSSSEYDGNIYKIYNTAAVTGGGNLGNEQGSVSDTRSLYFGIYTYTSLGTIICDEEYLEHVFGELKFVRGSLEDTLNTSKLIVTDYFADSIIVYNSTIMDFGLLSTNPEDPYETIMSGVILNRYQIGAIIDTGYKERYKDLIDKYNKTYEEPQNKGEILREIFMSEESRKMYEEFNNTLNFTYSLNQNFYEDYFKEQTHYAVWLRNSVVDYGTGKANYNSNIHMYADDSLEDNTILLEMHLYNEWFGASLTPEDLSGFEEKTITISNRSMDQSSDEAPKDELTLRVVGISNYGVGCLGLMDRKSYQELAVDALYVYALAFDNIEEALMLNNLGEENYFYTPTDSFSKIFEMCNIINIFSDIFIFIALVLIVIALIVIVSHNLRTIKKNQYRIGVYRSLGCSSKVFIVSCIFNTLILVGLAFVTSLFFTSFSSSYVNEVLIENFSKFVKLTIITDFTFVEFDLFNLIFYMFVILLVSCVSMISPIIKLKRLKPNLILNKSE